MNKLLTPLIQVLIHPQFILQRGQKGTDEIEVVVGGKRGANPRNRDAAAFIVEACNLHEALLAVEKAAFDAKEDAYSMPTHDALCEALGNLKTLRESLRK